MKPELKKLLLLNLPYLLFVYLFAKCGQAYRLAAGADASAKLLHLTSGISAAFASPLPSLHPFDLCGRCWGGGCPSHCVQQGQERQEVPQG